MSIVLRSLVAIALLAPYCAAFANIYKCVDDNGQVTFADLKTRAMYKNCQLFLRDDNQPASSSPTPKSRSVTSSSPSDFPRIDKSTQKKRDDKRRDILQAELDSEKQALAEAKQAYEEGREKPEVYRGADGKIFRNVPKYEAKMQRLQTDVDAHAKNVELLQKELDRLK